MRKSHLVAMAFAAAMVVPVSHSFAQTSQRLEPVTPVLSTIEDMEAQDVANRFEGVQKIGNKKSYRFRAPALEVDESLVVTSLDPPKFDASAGGPRATFVQDHDFTGLTDNGTSIPPDTMGAVGPSHVMTLLNSQFRYGTKPAPGGSPSILSTTTSDVYWGVSAGSSFDHHVVFDPGSGRWISASVRNGFASTSGLMIAASTAGAGDAPLPKQIYYIDADADNNEWVDYPLLGVNNTWIAVTGNMFTFAGSFTEARMWVFNKAEVIAGSATTPTVIAPLSTPAGNAFTVSPAMTYGSEASLWTVSSGFTSGANKALSIGRITGTAASPTWAHQTFLATPTVAYNFSVPFMQQSGANDTVDGGDSRAGRTTFYNGKLYTSHNCGLPAGGSNRAAFAWYEITPSPIALNRGGVVDPGVATSDFSYGTIAPLQTGQANPPIIGGCTVTSDSTFLSSAAFFIDASSSTVSDPTTNIYSTGTNNYFKDFGGGANRWGDYSHTMIDPSDSTRVWTLQESCEGGANTWRTNWASYRVVGAANVQNYDMY